MSDVRREAGVEQAREEPEVEVVGLPFDANSSYRRGAALAPPRIREAFGSDASNLWTETSVDLGLGEGWRFGADLALDDPSTAFGSIEAHVAGRLSGGERVVSLGGDHSITVPLLRAYGAEYPGITLAVVDAHPDLYDELDGSRDSHACVCARISEEARIGRLVQIGIRTANGHQREQAARFGVEMIEMRQLERWRDLRIDGPVYLSLDLDGLDPAHAPGVSHQEPGGPSTREVLRMIHHLPGTLVGADIVELNPELDVQGTTARVAAKLLKEILGRMSGPGRGAPVAVR